MNTEDVAVDPVRLFRDALPRHVRDNLNDTQLVAALVTTAVRDHGWTPTALAAEAARDLDGVANPGAVVTDRLRKAATHPPVGSDHKPAFGPPRPFCSPECADNKGWRLDPQTLLPAHRCPCRTQEAHA